MGSVATEVEFGPDNARRIQLSGSLIFFRFSHLGAGIADSAIRD